VCAMYGTVDVGSGTGVGSLGTNPVISSSGRMRACLEAVLVNQVMSVLHRRLSDAGLLRSFVDVEMPSLLVLAKMELNGFGAIQIRFFVRFFKVFMIEFDRFVCDFKSFNLM